MADEVAALQAANAQAQINNAVTQAPSQAALAAEMQTHIAANLRAETLVMARTQGSGVNINGLAHDLRNLPDKKDNDAIVQATINRLSPADQAALQVAMGQPDNHPGPGFLQRLTRRIEGHIGDNFSEAFAEPLGPSKEFMKPTDEAPGYLWPIQMLNNVVYRVGGATLDAVGRTATATYNSLVDAAVDTGDEVVKAAGFGGIPEDGRLRRDLKSIPAAFAGSPSTVMRSTVSKSRVGTFASEENTAGSVSGAGRRTGKAGGNWPISDGAKDPKVVKQFTTTACGPACGEMVLSDRQVNVSQKLFGGHARNTESLVSALNKHMPGWQSGLADGTEAGVRYLSRRGSWVANMRDWNSTNNLGHFVVVDGVNAAGKVMIRDPWNGYRYTMEMKDFLHYWTFELGWKP